MSANTMPVVNPRGVEFHQNPFRDYRHALRYGPIFVLRGLESVPVPVHCR